MAEIICPISGIRMMSAPYLLGFKLQQTHPIFRAKRRDLITSHLIETFRKSESTIEKKLIFLGILHCTDLVQFSCVASPSLKTIEVNFKDAFEVAGWIDYAAYQVPKGIALPHYIVRFDNADIANIGPAFLEPINAIRKAFLDKIKDKEQGRIMQEQIDKLFREFNDVWKKDRFFTNYTIRWLFEYCELDEHPKVDRWKSLLSVPVKDAWGMPRDELVELKEIISENFEDHNHPCWEPIIGQVNQLIQAQQRGSGDFEVVEVPETYIDKEGNQQTRMTPIGEAYKQRMLQQYGKMPLEKPQLKDFPTRPAWLFACAQWNLAMIQDKETKEQKQKEGEDDGV